MMIVLDEDLTEMILEDRRAKGNRLRDEVWEGVTYIMPEPNSEHQDIAWFFGGVFFAVFSNQPTHKVQGTPNLSDRVKNWKNNFRNPDLAYFSPGCAAVDRGTFWVGGPDFLLEIVSPDDKSRDKLPFYASIGTKEVLIVDRDPWKLELYQLRKGQLRLTAVARPGHTSVLASSVVPLTFELLRGKPRPKIRITHTETGQEWTF